MRRFLWGILVFAGILVSVTFIPAQGGAEAPGLVQEAQADTIFIQIVPDADSVRAEPNSVTVRPGQVVTWITDLGEWEVKFKSREPFGDRAVGEGIRGGRGQRNGRGVRPNAAAGTYKYDIKVRVQGGRNLQADPEIVVRPAGRP